MANRIDVRLGELKEAGEIALAPFVTVGFPDVELSQALAETLVDAGADMLELGVPFSDPLADGPTVQSTSFRALQHGVTVKTALEVATGLRTTGVEVPLVLMGYYNPFLRFGPRCSHPTGLPVHPGSSPWEPASSSASSPGAAGCCTG